MSQKSHKRQFIEKHFDDIHGQRWWQLEKELLEAIEKDKEQTNTSWPSVNTSYSENVKALGRKHSKEFEKILQDKFNTPHPEQFSREAVVGFVQWIRNEASHWRIRNHTNDDFINDMTGQRFTTSELLTEYLNSPEYLKAKS